MGGLGRVESGGRISGYWKMKRFEVCYIYMYGDNRMKLTNYCLKRCGGGGPEGI
jgi:hypothetical protein